MRQLIRHLLNENSEEMVAKSFLHCHVKGLHSIMFLESPGKTIRMFIADETHELYRNDSKHLHDGVQSIAFHPHHCNITLHVLYGCIHNWIVEECTDRAKAGFTMNRWIWNTAIGGKGGYFSMQEKNVLLNNQWKMIMRPGMMLNMPADHLHTVFVPFREKAAWFVYEGMEDPNYKPICYSNAELTKFSSAGLYQPITREHIIQLLKSVELL